MNVCHNLVNANLVPEVKNPDPKLGPIGFIKFLNLAKFFLAIYLALTLLLPLLTSSMILSLLTGIRSFTKSSTPMVLSIKVSKTAIRLNP